MTANLRRVEDLLEKGTSKKATDKKKCVTVLLEMLEDKEVVTDINNSSKNAGTVNWTRILHAVHKIVLAEADKVPTKETPAKIYERGHLCKLLIIIVREATNQTIPCLECFDLVSLVLQILEKKMYQHYQETYLDILTTYILPIKIHRINMSTLHWNELFKTCMYLCEKNLPNASKRTALEALYLIVKYGCLYSDIVVIVKQTISFLERLIEDKNVQEFLIDHVYKLVNIICFYAGSERRIAFCKFGEEILHAEVIYSSNDTPEKYKFLLFIVQAHHPKGVFMNSNVAFAYNKSDWRMMLGNIYIYIMENCKASVLPESFIHLAAEVFQRILKDPDTGIEAGFHNAYHFPSPSKRRRIDNGMKKLSDTIVDCSIEDAWPMFQIIETLLKKYPECLPPKDFVLFLKIATDFFLRASTREEIMESLYRLAAVLLDLEIKFANVDISENTQPFWDKIWDVLLRSLHMNQNDSGGHRLLQSFIKNNKVVNANMLTRLYFRNTIKWTPNSYHTLLLCYEHMMLPNKLFNTSSSSLSRDQDFTNSNYQILLERVQWCKLSSEAVIDDLADILVNITYGSGLGRKIPKTKKDILSFDTIDHCPLEDTGYSNELIPFDDIEYSYLLTEFQLDLLNKQKTEELCNGKDIAIGNLKPSMEIMDDLVKSLCDILEKINNDSDVCTKLSAIILVAKIISNMKSLNILPDSCEIRLVCTMELLLKNTCEFLSKLNASESTFTYLINITKMLGILYGSSYDVNVAKSIICSATLDMIKRIFDLFNIEDNDTIDYHDTCVYYENLDAFQSRRRRSYKEQGDTEKDNRYEEGIIRMQAIKALSLFCCMEIGKDKNEIQTKLMERLLTVDMYDLTRVVDFKMAIIVIDCIVSHDKEKIYEVYIKDIEKFFSHLLKKCYKSTIYYRCTFKIIPKYLKCISNYGLSLASVINFLQKICEYMKTKKCGPTFYIEFIDCVSDIISMQFDIPEFENVKSLAEYTVSHITSPFHNVRLRVIRYVHELLTSDRFDFKWKKLLFKKIEDKVSKVFHVSTHIEQDETADEKKLRAASALLLLTCVIYSNSVLQSEALYIMLQLIVEKGLHDHVYKILNLVMKQIDYPQLIEDNLGYLVWKWLTSGQSLNTFPWNLSGSDSQEEFYKKYITTLIPIQIHTSSTENLTSLFELVNVPFQQAYENMFPLILPSLLYYVCEDVESPENIRAIYRNLVKNQDEFKTTQRFSELLTRHLDELIVNLIKHLHDEIHFKQIFRYQTSFPKVNLPYFKKTTIDKCFKYMETNLFAEERSLLHILAVKRQSTMQMILLTLAANIYRTKFEEHKIKAFYQYSYFCDMIIQEIKEDYFDSMSMYIIRDVSYTLLNLIKKNNGILSDLCCTYFLSFIKCVLPTRIVEIKEILNHCTMILVPIVQRGKMPVALDVLEFLIIEQQNVLSKAIGKLDSFPNIPAFQDIRKIHQSFKYQSDTDYNLEREIQHFLDATKDKSLNCNVESLSNLRYLLSARKTELRAMYEELENSRGFAEDCATSILHRLIYILVKLAESRDIDVAMEAAKCLGELGPADLTTTILYADQIYGKENVDVIEILLYKIVMTLTNCLVQDDIKLRKVSANSLYVIFSSLWGQRLTIEKNLNELQTIIPEFKLRLDYLQPFILKKTPLQRETITINKENFQRVMNANNPIWSVESCNSYCIWIVEIAHNITKCFSDIPFLMSLIPVLELNIEFCETILPRLIFLLIHVNKNFSTAIYSCINKFFQYHFQSVQDKHKQNKKRCDRKSVRCMLNIVNYLRIQAADNVPLELNYIYIAKAAQYCSAYFTALLYAELSFESLSPESDDLDQSSKIDSVCEREPEQGRFLRDIYRDACIKIGDPDAIYGCGSTHLIDQYSRLQHYMHTRKWDKVLLNQDIEHSFGNNSGVRDTINALQQCGLPYLVNCLVSTIKDSDIPNDNELQYECAWRLSQWHIHTTKTKKTFGTDVNYNADHYLALKYFHENDESNVKVAIRNARSSIIKTLCDISLESTKTVYEKMMQLQMLREIEELSSVKPDEYINVLHKWQEHDVTYTNEFQYVEPILTQRVIMFQKDDLCENLNMKSELANMYFAIAQSAENHGYFHRAMQALGSLEKRCNLSTEISKESRYRESHLAWKNDDREIGRVLLRSLVNDTSLEANLRARVLTSYGNLMAETKLENPQMIIERYYEESIKTSKSIPKHTPDTIKDLNKTQVALAQFADAKFEQISTYMKSSQYENLKKCVQYSNRIPESNITSKDKDIRKAAIISQKQSSNDVVELENIQREKNNYLLLALRYYLKTLQQSDDYNLLIFRVVSLWFNNRNDAGVNRLLKQNLTKIPSFKYIPLIPQIAVHISHIDDEFSEKINEIVRRCASDHPHHTLPVLLALKNSYRDNERSNKNKKDEPRILGANRLITDLNKTHVGSLVQKMDTLSHSLVMLTNLTLRKDKSSAGSVSKIPRDQPILNVKNFEDVLVPTLTINVRPNRDYNNVIGIWRYEETFENVGGVNVPKKIICVGTDGIRRKQLVKGNDDLRQDAVMQQVFNIINKLLNAKKETKRRKLHIRTYKVVPLTQKSGIIEWCDDTIPIVSALVGPDQKSGIHGKYFRNDYTADICRLKIFEAAKKSMEIKLKVFLECCAHMHPAFHYFFLEKYPSPEIWFDRRIAYTRSVATTSMAGYILGLGDRHLSNILIDQSTAEVIHIDLGIAFDQGKVLPIPETVPFRLTRNIVAAMGVSGVEGIMKRSCEETLLVLREQRQIIITLLQVLLYDPLWTWALTPAKAHSVQSGRFAGSTENNTAFQEINQMAERALLRIEQKLQGTEEGLTSSVAGQVERLIQQARDPSNLSQLFCGWQAYL